MQKARINSLLPIVSFVGTNTTFTCWHSSPGSVKDSHSAFVTEMQSCSSCSLEAEKGRSLALKENSFQDHKAHGTILEPGEKVLVRNRSDPREPGKRKEYWEEQIHVVVGKGRALSTRYIRRKATTISVFFTKICSYNINFPP